MAVPSTRRASQHDSRKRVRASKSVKPVSVKPRKALRVLMVTHYGYPHSGGIEQATFNQAQALVKRGVSVTILTSNIPEGPLDETVAGVRFIRVPASRILEQGSNVPYTVFTPALAAALRRIIPTVDVVHVHGSLYHSSWAAIRIAKKHGKPVVLTEHVGRVPYTNPVLQAVQATAYALAGTRAARAADHIIVLTEEVRAHVAHMRKSDAAITLIPNGIDTTFFAPLAPNKRAARKAELGVPPGRSLIVFNGRLIEKKGYQMVLDALTQSQFAICIGSGNPPATYTDKANIRFIGTVPQAHVRDILQGADCFVLPSVGEGFPVATMEALSVGVPTVLSQTPSNEHYVPASATVYVQRTTADVARGIAEASTRDAKLRSAGRALATKTMSIERSAAELERIYREVAHL